jgi:hypothetical protein
MKSFSIKILIFTLIICITFSAGISLPTTPRASRSYFYSSVQKDSLLANADAPRMIFIGGSNISFGLDCQMIKDSLNVNPINTGIDAGFGLKYMLDNTIQYIKEGDIVIAPLEYHHYTRDYRYCNEALLRLVLDVDSKYVRLLNLRQALNLLSNLQTYLVSKFKPTSYFGFKIDPPYDRNSFNIYGDEYAHWDMENCAFEPDDRLDDFNPDIISKLKEFEKAVEQRGGRFYIAYPSYMEKSFRMSDDIISHIQTGLENNFTTLGTPTRYMIPDSLMFDTSYHLNRKGVTIRTARLIEDIQQTIVNKPSSLRDPIKDLKDEK